VDHFSTVPAQELVNALNELHLGASVKEHAENYGSAKRYKPREMVRAIHWPLQSIFFLLAFYCDEDSSRYVWGACIALSYVLFYKAWFAIVARRANVEFLMATAVIGSLVQGEFMEAASVGVIVTLMDNVVWLSAKSVERRLQSCISVPPSLVTLKDGRVIQTSDLRFGMEFLVRAGDGIPADGSVTSGEGTVDESRVTGEAMPIAKDAKCGDSKVYSGSVLQTGCLEVRADADAASSFQSKVMDSVQQAKNTLSNTQAIVGKFAVWYTPLVILIATVIAIDQRDINQFLVIIVAGCPCALLGAAPFVQAVTFAVLAKRHKMLLKEATALEDLARLKMIGFDKTGTITTGHFQLMKIKSFSEHTQKELHQWVSAVETKDTHPLARSIAQSYTGCLGAFAGWDGLPAVSNFKREGRNGVRGDIEGRTIGVGNLEFLTILEISLTDAAEKTYQEWSQLGTCLFITVDKTLGGALLMDDSPRGDAKGTVDQLKTLGILPVLLTGDKETTALRIADEVGIDKANVHARLMPEDKASLLLRASWCNSRSERLPELEKGCLQQKRGPVEVGFIGDGLNDCPALANAHVGIAIQEVGSQATADAASAVLQGDIGHLPAAVIIARRAQKLVMANITLALAINTTVIVIAATRGLDLWLSVLLDNGSLLAVLLNSLWPLCWHVDPAPDTPEKQLNEAGGLVAFRVRGESFQDLG
jgi:Cd2+/Zn2+-exporting ATPase